MSKGAKNKGDDTEISAVLTKSRKVFAEAYAETDKVSALIAQVGFDQLVEKGMLPVSQAHRILNNPKEVKKWLAIAEKNFLKSEQGKITKLLKNTSFKSAVAAGVASGVAVGTVFCLLSPFVTALLQSTANELVSPSSKTEATIKPDPAPQQGGTTYNTTINNFYYKKELPAPKVPKKGHHKKTVHRRHHLVRQP